MQFRLRLLLFQHWLDLGFDLQFYSRTCQTSSIFLALGQALEYWVMLAERPGLVKIGILTDAVPVTGFAPNFSPIPRIAPPPFGRDIAGKLDWPLDGVLVLALVAAGISSLFLLFIVC